MSIDVDAGAALVTAALVAGEIDEGKDKQAGAGEHGENCANCGAVLAGPFCQSCGQRAHVHRSLLHLGEEFLHGLLHFDAKAWRTLPLLVFRPGQLTRRYLDGQRTRFVSPLALFLFMMFFMFFVASYTSGNGAPGTTDLAASRATLVAELDRNKVRLRQAETALADASAKGLDPEALAEEVEGMRLAVKGGEQGIAMLDGALRADSAATAGGTAKSGGEGEPAKGGKGIAVDASADKLGVMTGIASIDTAIEAAKKNPDLTMYKLKSAASKFTFVLVPISLPFLWLVFFWRRGVTMYDHAVFVLYSLSFMAVLVSTAFLLKYAGLKTLVAWLLLAPPIHMFAQLRGSYKLGVGGALWRTAYLMLSAALVMLMYLLLILVAAVR